MVTYSKIASHAPFRMNPAAMAYGFFLTAMRSGTGMGVDVSTSGGGLGAKRSRTFWTSDCQMDGSEVTSNARWSGGPEGLSGASLACGSNVSGSGVNIRFMAIQTIRRQALRLPTFSRFTRDISTKFDAWNKPAVSEIWPEVTFRGIGETASLSTFYPFRAKVPRFATVHKE